MQTEKNQNETHIMVDVESLGKKPNAAIVSIGAVVFDPYAFPTLGEQFEVYICPGLVESAGFGIEQETLDWWHLPEQAEAAKISLNGETSPEEAMHLFADWLNQQGEKANRIIWTKGQDFDIPKIENHFERFGIEIPYEYQNKADVRTVFRLAKRNGFDVNTLLRPEPEHTALWDAVYQASAVHQANIMLGIE